MPVQNEHLCCAKESREEEPRIKKEGTVKIKQRLRIWVTQESRKNRQASAPLPRPESVATCTKAVRTEASRECCALRGALIWVRLHCAKRFTTHKADSWLIYSSGSL